MAGPLKPKLRADLTVVELDGEAIVYHEETRKLHHLNPTATIVLDLCDGQSTIGELSAEIAGAFALDREEVERQVRTLLRNFRKEELLEGARTAGTPVKGNGTGTSKATPQGRNGTRSASKRSTSVSYLVGDVSFAYASTSS